MEETTKIAGSFRRARSEMQKQDRQDVILANARDFVAEVGFDAVTMAALAKRAGVAKGTLYLYFKTKEEVFLALTRQMVTDFVDAVIAGASEREELVDALEKAAVADPLFLSFIARVTTVIETNIPPESLVQSKRDFFENIGRLTGHVGELLSLDTDAANSLTMGIMMVLMGAASTNVSHEIDNPDLPEDVRQMIAMTRFEATFAPTVRLLLK